MIKVKQLVRPEQRVVLTGRYTKDKSGIAMAYGGLPRKLDGILKISSMEQFPNPKNLPAGILAYNTTDSTLNYSDGFGNWIPLSTSCITKVDLSPTEFEESDWVQDRYAPAIFVREAFEGVDCVRLGVSEDDWAANRPPGFQGAFYDFQGMAWYLPERFYLTSESPVICSTDVYIPESWRGTGKYLSIWTRVRDETDTITRHPAQIIYCSPGFANDEVVFYATDGSGAAAGGLVNTSYDTWVNFSTRVYPDRIEYYVDGILNYTRAETDAFVSDSVVGLTLHNYNHPSYAIPVYDDFRASNIFFEKINCND